LNRWRSQAAPLETLHGGELAVLESMTSASLGSFESSEALDPADVTRFDLTIMSKESLAIRRPLRGGL
jgi:hypothetical protein